MAEIGSEDLRSGSGQPAIDYFSAIEREGVEACLTNAAGTTFRIVEVDDCSVPILVCEGLANNASLVSPSAQYLEYPVYEMSRDKGFLRRLLLQCVALPLRGLFRLTKFDRVVFVNHWLLLGGDVANLSTPAWEGMFRKLQNQYPGHAVVFPGIVQSLSTEARQVARVLRGVKALDIRSRTVYLLDPNRPLGGGKNRKRRYRQSAERRHYGAHLSRMLEDRDELKKRVSRIHELYRQLYLERYPKHLNPQYTQRFFEILLDCDAFEFCSWESESGEIEAFNVQLVNHDHLGWSAAGYDQEAPKGLFRLVAAADLVASLDSGKILNWGAGNEHFKRLSGAVAEEESEFALVDHMSWWRRLPWLLLRLLRGRPSEASR